ncbi:hypothetical protein [Gemmata sp.]|uniref:hypothetical protein n=1 Tax=Gemmata sp. TaxID=1914242 RepID=UPI003F72F33E
MRTALLALFVALVGCSRRDAAGPGVQIAPHDPTAPSVGDAPQPPTLLELDFLGLWDRTATPRPSVEEQQRLYHGLVVYADHPEECLAAEIVGGGFATPLAVWGRHQAQRAVVKRVRAAAEQPPSVAPVGGLIARSCDGTRTVTVIAVVDEPAAARERFRELVEQGVVPAVAAATGSTVAPEPLAGAPSGVGLTHYEVVGV